VSQPDMQPGGHTTCGVQFLGIGSAVPEQKLTNRDLEKIIDTSDEWITQRTGVRERRVMPADHPSPTVSLAAQALSNALHDAGMTADQLDLIILGTVSSEMSCPSTACRVAAELGATPAAAFDLAAACCGFVYSLNIAETLIATGRYRNVGIIGCDIMSAAQDYHDRSRGTCILFGDAAGAAVLGPTDDVTRGCIGQVMHADGRDWSLLFIPNMERDFPDDIPTDAVAMHKLYMKGRDVYKFAVSKFSHVIAEILEKTDTTIDEIDMIVAHQSNQRIIDSARQKFGIPEDKVYINIDRYGNSSAGSVGLCLDELWRAGRVKRGDKVLFVAFGGGMTWTAALWQL
jgi:3-oxoacyl-[acyl-carrier-protein] synthase-3